MLCIIKLNDKTNYWNIMTRHLPQFEVGIIHSVGESFTANTDTLKYTVTGKLVHDQMGINDSGLFQFIGNDTTDEMRLSGSQCSHQVVELFLVG